VQTVQIIQVLLSAFPQLLILYVECLVGLIELFLIMAMLRVLRVFFFNMWGYKGQKFFRL
jgi:hypothetical protein